MAKFMKSKIKVLWGTVFAFFYGFFANDVIAQDQVDSANESEEEEDENGVIVPVKEGLSPIAIAAAVAAACYSRC